MKIEFHCLPEILSLAEVQTYRQETKKIILEADRREKYQDSLGWMDVHHWADRKLMDRVESIAAQVRETAEVFAVVGLGGSNQGARAIIEALQHKSLHGPKIIYPALYLSSAEWQRVMACAEHKSLVVDVIAQNFRTLEPGVAFRLLRDWMAQRYGEAEARKRIITTPSCGRDALDAMTQEYGYLSVPFPNDVGGRYSVFTPVGLLPLAVAGVDVEALIQGASEAQADFEGHGPLREAALEYALTRNLLYQKGYDVEVLALFEPAFQALGKWWRQLYGESEGKNQSGIFPAIGLYTEELHSLGQFMQEGKRHIMETFLHAAKPIANVPIGAGLGDADEWDDLKGKTLNDLNEAAYLATVTAHTQGGVPCQVVEIEQMDERHLGRLMYTTMMSCYYSAALLGVNPIDQPGVEAYKIEMFKRLITPQSEENDDE